MSWKTEILGNLLIESRIPALNPNPNRRIRVRLNVAGVEKRPIENEIEGATKQFIRRSGQFIYGKQNFHKGAFGIIPPELDGYETSADIPSFDVRNDCLPEWIFYFFKINNRYIELEKIARGMGSKRIHPEQLADIKIPFPSIDEQRLYISRFNKLEILLLRVGDEHYYQLDLLNNLRQQILQDAVQGKLVPQEPNDEPASNLLERIKSVKEKLIKEKNIRKGKPLPEIKAEELPFEIPESWVWCKLDELRDYCYSLSYGVLVPGNDIPNGIPFVRVQDLDMAYKNELPSKHISKDVDSKYSRTRLIGGEILICVVGSIGKIAMTAPNWIGANIARAVCRFMPNNNLSREYLYYALCSPYIQKYFHRGTKSVNPTLNVNILERTILPIPPTSEQHRIVAKIEQLMKICDELEQTILQNQKYTQDLLQVALKEALEAKS